VEFHCFAFGAVVDCSLEPDRILFMLIGEGKLTVRRGELRMQHRACFGIVRFENVSRILGE